MRLPCTAGLLALPLLAACGAAEAGEHDPAALTDAGYAALGESDWATARQHFEGALALLEQTGPREIGGLSPTGEPSGPGSTDFTRAALGQIEALVHLDAELAQERLLSTSAAHPGVVGPREFTNVGGLLASEGQYPQAIAVLGVGLEAHPNHPQLLAALDLVEQQAEHAGDAEALDAMEALRSMAYVGGKR